VFERDPASKGYLQPFLFFKGFQALQVTASPTGSGTKAARRWPSPAEPRLRDLPDRHPPGRPVRLGVFIDHGTGVTVGETAVVGDDVSMLHGVTLGGTGAERGDRHPKIGRGVLLGAGASILGNITVGDHAKVASGSVVLKPVPPGCTAAGVPARLVNCSTCPEPARTMDHTLADVVYDYVI
jgi:serine O-acetyltransferase